MKVVAGGRGIVPAKEQGRYLFECDKPNCFRHLTFKTLEAARLEEGTHACPWWGGETRVSWSVTKTLVQQMWDKLDEVMELVMNPDDDPEYWPRREEKAKARGIAECLAIFMQPFFTTADEIAKEAARRYKAKQAGDTEYETPGIGARRYEVALDADKYKKPTPAPKALSADHVPDDEKAAIKFALESGMFQPAQLAKTYKYSVEVIELIRNS